MQLIPICRCGYDQIFSPSTYHPLDGILGLGRGKASLISQLNSQGLVRNVIGHCLSSRGGGYIFFGNVYDSSRMSWTPISSIDSLVHQSHFTRSTCIISVTHNFMRSIDLNLLCCLCQGKTLLCRTS